MKHILAVGLLAAAFVVGSVSFAADAAPGGGPAPGAGGDQPGGGAGRGGGNRRGGPGGNFDPQMFAGMMGGMGGQGGVQGIFGMASRMLGMDIEDPKAGPKLDALPLGADKRFIFNVPVGGVDNFSAQANGWKMEAVFKMTDEQTTAAEKLREEYTAEQKKLEQEIKDQYKAMAEKLKQLRAKYELRANDILTGDDKGRKEKMDVLARETNTKNSEILKDLMPLYDINDFGQRMALARAIRDKAGKNAQAAEAKLLELVPPENKEKMEGVIKQQAEARDAQGRMGNWNAGGRGRPGGGGGDDAVKPPRPPEADKKADF